MTRLGVSDTAVHETATRPAPADRSVVEDVAAEPSQVPAEPESTPPSSSSRWTDTLLIGLAVLIGFGVRLAFAFGDHIVSPDESTYLTTGMNFWAGQGFTTLSGGAELHFPPGLPFLLGGIHELIGGDPHTATVIVNLLTTTLLILPITGIASLVAGRRAAVLAAFVAALCPAITWLPLNAGGSAGLFALLAVTALWLALQSATWKLLPAALAAAACGVLIAAAYLTRPEGLLYSVVLIPVLAFAALGGWRGIRHAKGRAWGRAGLLVAAFTIPLALMVAPYVAYLHTHTGTWQLTAKSKGGSIDSWRAIAKGDRGTALAEQYRLDRSGYGFPRSQSTGELVVEHPADFVSIVGTNLTQLYTTLFNASSIPYPHWQLLPAFLLLIAAFGFWRRRHERAALATIAAIAVPVVTAISYFVLPRYLIPSIALACALVAVGLMALPGRWVKIAVVLTFVLLVSSVGAGLYGNANGWFHPTYAYPEHQAVGKWIGEHSAPDDLVMSTSKVVGYYSNRNIVAVPYAGQGDVIEFGRHFGVRYLVIDQVHLVQFRPHLQDLLYKNPWQALRKVHVEKEGQRRTVVYEIEPRSPSFAGRAPLLDHIGEAS